MKPDTIFRAALVGTAILLPGLGLINLVQSHNVSVALRYYLGGRAGTCSLMESLEGGRLARTQIVLREKLGGASRVVSRDAHYSLWDTPAGKFWAPTASGSVLLHELAEQERGIYGHRIRPGDVVLDGGANIGVFTREALRAGAGQVIAIEPAPENLECLRRNFASEIAAGRVVIYPKGIWNKDDVLRFSVDPTNSAADTYVEPIQKAQVVELPVTTLDRMVGELHLSRVDFIKMDIEGAERQAIAGARQTISTFRPRMALCIYHLPGDERAIPQMVTTMVPQYKVSQTCICTLDSIAPEVAFFYQ